MADMIKIRMKLKDYLEKFDILAELLTVKKKTPKRKERAVAEIVKKRESGNIYFSLRKDSSAYVLIRLEPISLENQTLSEII
jgi:hypothetical protein